MRHFALLLGLATALGKAAEGVFPALFTIDVRLIFPLALEVIRLIVIPTALLLTILRLDVSRVNEGRKQESDRRHEPYVKRCFCLHESGL